MSEEIKNEEIVENKETETTEAPVEEAVEVKAEETVTEEPTIEVEKPKNPNAKWYVVQVHSGCEKSVVKTLNEKIAKEGMEKKFEQLLVPTHEITEVKKGKKSVSERKFFPRYVLVKMELNDTTWHLVKDTPRVLGFLGARMKPAPISETEANALLNRLENTETDAYNGVIYEIGQQIKVCDGPFASFNGVVEEVDEEKQRLKVSVSIFGRPTQVDLNFSQVEKV